MNSALYTLIIVCHGLWLLFIIHPRVISIYDNYLLYTGEGNPNRNFSTHKYVIYLKLLQGRIHMNVDFVATLVNSILNVKRTYSEDINEQRWISPRLHFFFCLGDISTWKNNQLLDMWTLGQVSWRRPCSQ